MKINHSKVTIGWISTAMLGLAGCTTYVVQQPPPPAYAPPVVVEEPAPPPAVVVAPTPPANVEVVIRGEDDFVEPLRPYGEWVFVAGYGRCWRPVRVEREWRPYGNGHWRATDAGWFWESDEPWAWATYHYGRWELTANFGWVWLPQTEWAPAWVDWREGGGYVGWAPLRPERRVDAAIVVPFVFIEERRFQEPVRPTTVIINNTTVINKTVVITKTKVVNKVVINEGPRTDVVEHATGHKLEAVSVRELRHREEAPVAAHHFANPVRTETTAPPPRIDREAQRPVVAPEPHRVEPPVRVEEKPAPHRPPAPTAVVVKPDNEPEPKPAVLRHDNRLETKDADPQHRELIKEQREQRTEELSRNKTPQRELNPETDRKNARDQKALDKEKSANAKKPKGRNEPDSVNSTNEPPRR